MTAFAITMSVALVLIAACWAVAWWDVRKRQADRDEKVSGIELERLKRVEHVEHRASVQQALDAMTQRLGVVGERVTDLEKAVGGSPLAAERRSRIRGGP